MHSIKQEEQLLKKLFRLNEFARETSDNFQQAAEIFAAAEPAIKAFGIAMRLRPGGYPKGTSDELE